MIDISVNPANLGDHVHSTTDRTNDSTIQAETPQMNFDFSDDQKLLQQTARDYLAEHSPLSVCREILEGDESYAAK